MASLTVKRRAGNGSTTLDEWLFYSKDRIVDAAIRVVEALEEWHLEKNDNYALADIETLKRLSGIKDEKLLLKALELLHRKGIVAKHTAVRKGGVKVTRWRLSNYWYFKLIRHQFDPEYRERFLRLWRKLHGDIPPPDPWEDIYKLLKEG